MTLADNSDPLPWTKLRVTGKASDGRERFAIVERLKQYPYQKPIQVVIQPLDVDMSTFNGSEEELEDAVEELYTNNGG
jgi:hypothetical protein